MSSKVKITNPIIDQGDVCTVYAAMHMENWASVLSSGYIGGMLQDDSTSDVQSTLSSRYSGVYACFHHDGRLNGVMR